MGISILYLYVEDEFYKLYWQGGSWERLYVYMYRAFTLFPAKESILIDAWKLQKYGQGMFETDRVSMGVWQIGPREWVAKIRYHRHSLPTTVFVDEQGGHSVNMEVYCRNKQVVLEDARLHFPNLVHVFHRADTAAQRKILIWDSVIDEVDQEVIPQLNPDTLQASGVTFDTNSGVVEEMPPPRFWPAAQKEKENSDEDFVNGEVELVGIAEAPLNSGPSGKRKRKEKILREERGNKKTTGVRNVVPLEEILQAKEMRLKGAAENLKVSRSALKRACREYGINRRPPRNEYKNIRQSLPNGTPAVVDQERFPLLTSYTLPSDQALTAGVDTNSVVLREIPPQFLLTAQQENLNENFGTDEFEAVGMGGVGTGEGEMKEGRLNSGCSGNGKRDEKTPGGERGSNKTTGVRIEIALEDILQVKDMCLKDAARELKSTHKYSSSRKENLNFVVSRSTLKRVCRNYNIHRWPPREKNKLISQSHTKESPAVVDQERIPQLNSDMLLPSNQNSATIDTNSVTVKAKYKGLRIKFQLFWPWRKLELEQEVKKRLQLDAATYYINYKDEDGEMTLIGCDEDLEGYISSSSHLGTRLIELFLEQK